MGVAACLHVVSALPRVIAVVRTRDVELRDLLHETGAQVIVCDRAHEGMGVTLATGVAAAPDADGWVVALADMPWIAPATIAAVAARVRDGASIVAPVHRGQRGHPVGFARAHRDALGALSGDEGARTLVASHRAVLELLDVQDPGVLLDVDRGEDLLAAPR
jgi:molybdenum cofactor cytidylyltransferase